MLARADSTKNVEGAWLKADEEIAKKPWYPTQGQILSQSPTDATRFWWHLYGS